MAEFKKNLTKMSPEEVSVAARSKSLSDLPLDLFPYVGPPPGFDKLPPAVASHSQTFGFGKSVREKKVRSMYNCQSRTKKKRSVYEELADLTLSMIYDDYDKDAETQASETSEEESESEESVEEIGAQDFESRKEIVSAETELSPVSEAKTEDKPIVLKYAADEVTPALMYRPVMDMNFTETPNFIAYPPDKFPDGDEDSDEDGDEDSDEDGDENGDEGGDEDSDEDSDEGYPNDIDEDKPPQLSAIEYFLNSAKNKSLHEANVETRPEIIKEPKRSAPDKRLDKWLDLIALDQLISLDVDNKIDFSDYVEHIGRKIEGTHLDTDCLNKIIGIQ